MKELLIAIYFLIYKVNLLLHMQEDFITATQYFLEWDSNFRVTMKNWLKLHYHYSYPPHSIQWIEQTGFAQLQPIFMARITLQKTKFAHVVEKLPVEIAHKILDLLNSVWGESIWHTEKQFYTRLVSQKKRNYQVFVIMSPLKIVYFLKSWDT